MNRCEVALGLMVIKNGPSRPTTIKKPTMPLPIAILRFIAIARQISVCRNDNGYTRFVLLDEAPLAFPVITGARQITVDRNLHGNAALPRDAKSPLTFPFATVG